MDEYDLGGITPERIARLNSEQQAIVLKRQEVNAEIRRMSIKISESGPDAHGSYTDSETNQQLQDYLRDSTSDFCEHARSIWSSCAACEEIQKRMFPELYDENGDRIDES
jgi:hypothetical protein